MELFKIEAEELDNFLSYGWFRMQQTIFTTDTISFDNILYNTIWLRVCLMYNLADKKYNALYKRNNNFKTNIKKAVITPELETLFTTYKKGISFETASSLQSLLLGANTKSIYNTYMINVYDGSQLIGAGFFDVGKNSAAGICSFYDPGYKKYSLGKYMIYEKILYCKKEAFEYFYPGYYVPGYSLFDYKLDICAPAIEYFDTIKKEWFSLDQIGAYSILKKK